MRENLASADLILPALVVAGALHAAVIFGVRVELPRPAAVPGVLELSLMPKELGTRESSPAVRSPPVEESFSTSATPSLEAERHETKPVATSTLPAAAPNIPVPRLGPQPVKRSRRDGETKVSAQNQAESFQMPADIGGIPPQHATVAPVRLSAAALDRQISEWSAEYNQARERETAQPARIAYVEKVVAHRVAAAAYERAWQDKVERVGNMNYPEEARRKNLSGGLILSVGVNADGSIQSIHVRNSSGHEELDQAAIRIVRLAAPFSVFPSELKKDYDVLLITRTWRFFIDNHLATSP